MDVTRLVGGRRSTVVGGSSRKDLERGKGGDIWIDGDSDDLCSLAPTKETMAFETYFSDKKSTNQKLIKM